MAITTTNINTGGATVTVGGTVTDVGATGYYTGTTGGTNVGCTTGGVRVSYSFETQEIFCDQSLAAVESAITSETASVEFDMLETNAAHLQYALQQYTSASTATQNFVGVGGITTLTPIPLMLEIIDNDDSTKNTTWTFFKCINKSMEINFERENPTSVGCNFTVLADTDHASGHQLFDVIEDIVS